MSYPGTWMPARIRWLVAALCALAAAVAVAPAPANALDAVPEIEQSPPSGEPPALEQVAEADAQDEVTVIIQLSPEAGPDEAARLVADGGGEVTGEVPLINAVAARMPAAAAERLAGDPLVVEVTLNTPVVRKAPDPSLLRTRFNQATHVPPLWRRPATGRGVGVAVIDTGIAAAMPDFTTDGRSRVVASVVTNPAARTSTDTVGHGTHVAGIIAGNSQGRPLADPRRNSYAGAAPGANLVSVKVSDDEGNASVLDVLYGLQFAIDQRDRYGIRVVNLSLESTSAESYRTDPLAAAVEAAWFHGLVVVVAAGNRGSEPEAAHYAPSNDPFVISVGAIDDMGTESLADDAVAGFSSRGTTQDGVSKPEIHAPGAGIVSTVPAGSAFTAICPACIVDGDYMRVSGTSMAAPVVSGIVADMLEAEPALTPDEVKGRLIAAAAEGPGGALVADAAAALAASDAEPANQGVHPHNLIAAAYRRWEAAEGTTADPTASRWSASRWSASRWSASRWSASRWSASRWSAAPASLTAPGAGESWVCSACPSGSEAGVDQTASRWSASRWSVHW